MKHTKHVYCHCDGADWCSGCCLFSCSVCHGSEGSLPSECPGEAMTEEQQDAVYAGDIDFKNDGWEVRNDN